MVKKFLIWLLIFMGVFLAMEQLNPREKHVVDFKPFVLATERDSYTLGNSPKLKIQNNTENSFEISDYCFGTPFVFYTYERGNWVELPAQEEQNFCDSIVIPSGEVLSLDLGPWKERYFEEPGKYKVSLFVPVAHEVPESAVSGESVSDEDAADAEYLTEFEVHERGFLSSFMITTFYRPIYNILVFITEVLPGHNFGWALVVLTLGIRLLLLSPSQKALKSQRAMQKIQPEIDAIKKKYEGQQEKVAQETMALFKRHKVSPISSCLPILIQFPILIGLFYVVRDGLSPYDTHLLYDFLSHASIGSYEMHFLGVLNLMEKNITWLPISVGLMQFAQMKLTFAKQKSKDDKKVIDVDGDGKVVKTEGKKAPDPMKMMSKTMVYFLPLMIVFMTASLPSGVGLYWGVSTAFGVVQQLFVNREG